MYRAGATFAIFGLHISLNYNFSVLTKVLENVFYYSVLDFGSSQSHGINIQNVNI